MRIFIAWATLFAFAGWNGRAIAQECVPASPLAAAYEPVSQAEHVARIGDRIAMVGGLVAGGAMFLGVATVPVIAVAIAVSSWQMSRGALRLWKRHREGLPLSLRDPAARAAWLSVLAGGATIGAAGVHVAALALLAKPVTDVAFGLRAARRIDRVRDWLHDHLPHHVPAT